MLIQRIEQIDQLKREIKTQVHEANVRAHEEGRPRAHAPGMSTMTVKPNNRMNSLEKQGCISAVSQNAIDDSHPPQNVG